MEEVGIFYELLVHFTVFCRILLTLGLVCGNLVYFPPFGILYNEKSGNPAFEKCKSTVLRNTYLGLQLFLYVPRVLFAFD
jgi:hypothetical protein